MKRYLVRYENPRPKDGGANFATIAIHARDAGEAEDAARMQLGEINITDVREDT